jgi:hypothetical protein
MTNDQNEHHQSQQRVQQNTLKQSNFSIEPHRRTLSILIILHQKILMNVRHFEIYIDRLLMIDRFICVEIDEPLINDSSLLRIQESNGDRAELKIEQDESITPTPPTDEDNNNNNNNNHHHHIVTTNIDEQAAITAIHANQSYSDVKTDSSSLTQPARKRRKNIPSSKISRPSIMSNNVKIEQNIPKVSSLPIQTASSSSSSSSSSAVTATTTTAAATAMATATATKSNASMIFNLIHSLLEEKKSDYNDENLISTIDCLIDSLQHLRDKIKCIDNATLDHENSSTTAMSHFDETSPLNLSKPKVRHQTRLASSNSDDISPTTTAVSSPSPSTPTLSLPSALFPSQALFFDKPFFPPFSGELSLMFEIDNLDC